MGGIGHGKRQSKRLVLACWTFVPARALRTGEPMTWTANVAFAPCKASRRLLDTMAV